MKRIAMLLLVLSAGQSVAAEGLMDRAKQLFQPIPAAPRITEDHGRVGAVGQDALFRSAHVDQLAGQLQHLS